MADLKGNGLWDDVSKGGNDVADKVFGPAADYTDMIQIPAQKGVGEDGNVGQLITNGLAVGDYIKDLTMGPLLGNSQFVETGGMCKAPGGSVIPRWSYINNRVSGTDALPPKLKASIGGGIFDGIIPGMFGDLAALNPITMMNGLYLDGVPDCQAIVCPVTDALGNNPTIQTKFLTRGLEQNINSCVYAGEQAEKDLEQSEVEAVKTRTEGFEGMFSRSLPTMMVRKPDYGEWIRLGIAFVFLFGMGVTHFRNSK